MKKHLRYTLLVLIGCNIFVACSKKIDLQPTNSVDGENFFKQLDDYAFTLTGAYGRLKQNGLYSGVNGGSIYLSAVDVAADNFFTGPDNLGALNSYFRWTYTADDGSVQAAWDDAYRVVQQANLALRGIERFRNENPEKVNRIAGQARALRAFMHFELLRWFAPQYGRNSTAPGVPYVDSFDVERMPARGTVQQSFAKIEADLKVAKAMLSNTDEPVQSINAVAGTARSYIDSLVVNAMLARVYLYAAEWDSAAHYAGIVINARPLSNAAEFPLIWQDATTREVVWAINYQTVDAPLVREIYRPAASQEDDEISWRPVAALINSYEATDIRRPVYFVSRTKRGTTRTLLNKYFSKAGVLRPDGIVNFKVFRTAEMYLIRAEALAGKGQNGPALADLNTLRAARNATTGAETGAALQTAIQNERRKELLMEGHRFFDLKRSVRTVNRTQNCTGYCTLAADSRAWALPIPQTEILANKNISQNPGY